MSTYSNPIPVGNGTVSTFFTSYPPVQGNIGTNPHGWTFRSGYVAPFRSFDQQLVNASYGTWVHTVGSWMVLLDELFWINQLQILV